MRHTQHAKEFGNYPKAVGSGSKTFNLECHVHLLCSPAKAPCSPSADNRTHSWGLGGADSVLQAQVCPKKGLHDSSFSDWFTYRPMTLLGTCSAKTMWEDVLLGLGCAAGRV